MNWACVLDEPVSRLRFDYGTRGCFGGSDSAVLFKGTVRGVTLAGRKWVGPEKRERVGPADIGRARAEAAVKRLMAVMSTPEPGRKCSSTVSLFVRASVRCRGGSDISVLEDGLCMDIRVTRARSPEDNHSEEPPEVPNRVEMLHAALDALFDGPLVSRVTPPSPSEVRRERRRWDSLFFGIFRIRERPKEEWADIDDI